MVTIVIEHKRRTRSQYIESIQSFGSDGDRDRWRAARTPAPRAEKHAGKSPPEFAGRVVLSRGERITWQWTEKFKFRREIFPPLRNLALPPCVTPRDGGHAGLRGSFLVSRCLGMSAISLLRYLPAPPANICFSLSLLSSVSTELRIQTFAIEELSLSVTYS